MSSMTAYEAGSEFFYEFSGCYVSLAFAAEESASEAFEEVSVEDTWVLSVVDCVALFVFAVVVWLCG